MHRSSLSLRLQLVLWLLPLYLATTLLLAWKFYVSYRETIQHFMDTQMKVLALSSAISGCEDLRPPPPVDETFAREDGYFVLQRWCGGPPQSILPHLPLPLQPEPGWRDVRVGEHDWRVYTAPADAGPQRIQVAQSLEFRDDEVTGRAFFASAPALGLLTVSLGVLVVVIGRTSRRLRQAAERLSQHDEHLPVEAPGPAVGHVPAEIAPLVRAFEALLTRQREALAAQRRFVQDAAHELRTPLTVLQLQLENLRSTSSAAPTPVPDPEAYHRMQQGMARARHLVDQLLTLSRQEVGQRGALESLDLRALLRDCVADALPLADERQLDIAFVDHAPGPVSLSGVAQDLRSLFGNLLDNAIRHSPPGGEIELRLVQTPEGQRRVEIQDAGPGLPPALRERVFDRFYRAPDAPPGGSGLGLAIARQIGLRHGLRLQLTDRSDGQPGLVAQVHLP